MNNVDKNSNVIHDHNGRIAIVGGGLAGSLFALTLAQQGLSVDVFERRLDPRKMDLELGRSINLGLSKRGMQALSSVGLLEEVLKRSVTMKGRVIHSPDGNTRFQPYGKDEQEVLHSIDRNELNHLLLDKAEQFPQLKIHFNHRLVSINKNTRQIELEHGEQKIIVKPKWVVGADGAFSKMRSELQRGERADFHQEYLEWGYKELTLEANSDGTSAIELSALHVWPRSHCLFVSHPNRDGSHTLTLFLPFEGVDSFANVKTADDVTQLFYKYFPDLIPLLPGLLIEWFKHSAGSLITTRTSHWSFDDWAVLVGDACHAVYPFFGQGMNSAFEDCCLLQAEINKHGTDLAAAFSSYAGSRRKHTDALAELSKANFVELRKKVSSPWFAARKNLDLVINRMFPRLWLPLYSMIAHSTMPYGEALEKARRQEKILNLVSVCIMSGFTLIMIYLLRGLV